MINNYICINHKSTTVDTKNKVIHFRLTDPQYELLENAAISNGCKVSEMVKKLVFENLETAGKDNEAPYNPRKDMEAFRSVFKKLVSQHNDFVNELSESELASGEICDSIYQILLDIQQELNSLTSKASIEEMHIVVKPRSKKAKQPDVQAAEPEEPLTARQAADSASAKIELRIKYCYMEKIFIRGFIVSDATRYTARVSGQEMVRIPVVCTKDYPVQGGSTQYEVIMTKAACDPIFDMLKKDRIVNVMGTYDVFTENGLKNYIYADTIKFGEMLTKERLQDSVETMTIVGNLCADASSFFSKKGNNTMKMTVACNRTRKSETNTTYYEVVMKKTEVFDYLKKGRQVTVVGDYSCRETTDKNGAPRIEQCIYASSIALGGDINF